MNKEQLVAKKYLQQLGNIGGEIAARRFVIEKEWKRVVGGTGSNHLTAQISLAPAHGTKQYGWTAENIDHYLQLRDEQQKKIQALTKERDALIQMIDGIIEVRMRTVLIERYVNRRSWSEIAKLMKYSEVYTRKKLHAIALENFYKILVNSDLYKRKRRK